MSSKISRADGRRSWYEEEEGKFCFICSEFKFEGILAPPGRNVSVPFKLWD